MQIEEYRTQDLHNIDTMGEYLDKLKMTGQCGETVSPNMDKLWSKV